MSLRMLAVSLAVALVASAASLRAQSTAPIDSLALARQYTQWFYTGEIDSLWAHTSPAVRENLATPQAFEDFRAEFEQRAGTEIMLLEEKFVIRNGKPQYWRTASVTGVPEPILFRWVIQGGEIAGIGMGLKSQAPPIDSVSQR